MTGRPIVCQHCFYSNWINYLTKKYPIDCERCHKNLSTLPPVDKYETVNINGRLVKREKKL